MKKYRTILILFLSILICNSYVSDELTWRKPATFPKPVYTFKDNTPTKAGFELGRKLFYDPVLSADSTISCASCHQQFAAFAHIDHSLSHGIRGRTGTRNVPSLQNLIWNNSFMWDGGVNHLEVQPLAPITNEDEMGSNIADIIYKLNNNENYKQQFRTAFRDTISTANIMKALAQFTGLIISADSKYDRYVSGKELFNAAEKNGLEIFKNKCSSCHPPPLFTDNTYRNNGIELDTLLKDYGREKITQQLTDKQKFKVPALRNIAYTFPYMHDGRFGRLKEVIDHYGNQKFSSTADNAVKKIGLLNDKNKKDLIAFLLTLTDEKFLRDTRFSDPHKVN